MAARRKKEISKPADQAAEDQDWEKKTKKFVENGAAAQDAVNDAIAQAGPQPADPEDEEEDKLPELAAIPGFDAEHLTGQLGDFLVTEMKMARHLKPWDQLNEAQQREMIDRAFTRARGVVMEAAHAIAGKGFKSMPLRVDAWTVKDELKVVLTGVAAEAGVLALIRNKGALVQLVFADADAFAGAMLTKPAPDQPAMFDGDDEDPDADPDGEGDDAADEEIDPDTGEVKEPPPKEKVEGGATVTA